MLIRPHPRQRLQARGDPNESHQRGVQGVIDVIPHACSAIAWGGHWAVVEVGLPVPAAVLAHIMVAADNQQLVHLGAVAPLLTPPLFLEVTI